MASQTLQILYMVVLRSQIVTIFEPKMVPAILQHTNSREASLVIPSFLICGGSVPGKLVSQANRQARIFFSINGVSLKSHM